LKKEDIVTIALLIIGIGLIVAAFGIIFSSYPVRNSLDKVITDYMFTHVNSSVKSFFYYITLLGEALIYIGVLLTLYYVWDKKKVVRLMIVLFSSTIINSLFKYGFNLSRPPKNQWFYQMSGTSPGFPSGHAQMNTTFWGAISIVVKKPWLIITSTAIALLVSFSRIILCVHWFTDVIGGLGIGLVIVGLFMVFSNPLETWIQKQSKHVQLLITFLVFIIFTLPIVFTVRDSDAMIQQLKFLTLFTTVILSYIVEGEFINFDSRAKNWWKAITRVIIGIGMFFATYFGLKTLFGLIASAVGSTILQVTLDLVRYAVLGPVAILLSPWIIMKLKL